MRHLPLVGSSKSAASQVKSVSATSGAALADGSGRGRRLVRRGADRARALPSRVGRRVGSAPGSREPSRLARGERAIRGGGRRGRGHRRRGGRHRGRGQDRGAAIPAVLAQDQEPGAGEHDDRRQEAHDGRDAGAVIAGQVRATADGAADRVPRRPEGQTAVPAEPGHHVIAQPAHRADGLAGVLLVGRVATVSPQPREPHRGDGATGDPDASAGALGVTRSEPRRADRRDRRRGRTPRA